jgi:hypothetical protein
MPTVIGIPAVQPTDPDSPIAIPTANPTTTPITTHTPLPIGTPNPTQTPTTPPQTIMEFFPYYLGSSWTFYYNHLTADEQDPEKVVTIEGSFTDQVEFIESDGSGIFRQIGIRRTGTPPSTDPSTSCFGDTFWYLIEQNRLFDACSIEEIEELTQDHQKETVTGVMSDDLIWHHMYSVPLEVGDKWGGFGGISEEYSDYWWYVEAQEDVVVPAGNFKDCYRLIFRTNPDATVRWICPGIGVVAAEYDHFGSRNEVKLELINFSIPNAGDQSN